MLIVVRMPPRYRDPASRASRSRITCITLRLAALGQSERDHAACVLSLSYNDPCRATWRSYDPCVTEYRPPIQDIVFALQHVVGYDRLAALPQFEHADLETVAGMLEECGEFMAKVVAPINRDGDLVGSVRNPDGTVTTPESYRAAYAKLVESGWGSVQFPEGSTAAASPGRSAWPSTSCCRPRASPSRSARC